MTGIAQQQTAIAGIYAGHHRGTGFVVAHDDLEEILARPLGQLLHAHVVDDHHVGFEIMGQHLVFATQRIVVQEVADDVEDGAVEHGEAGLDRLVADGLHEVTLDHARRPQQQHITRLANEPASSKIEYLFALDRGIEAEVEVLNRPLIAEGGSALEAPRGGRFETPNDPCNCYMKSYFSCPLRRLKGCSHL